MASDIWRLLDLEPARLRDFEGLDGLDFMGFKTNPWNLNATSIQADGESRARRLQTLEDWRAQTPVERIVNTILLCAIRDKVQQITVDPQARGVHVRFTTQSIVRDHIKLPSFTLAPLAERFKTMAQLDATLIETQQGLLKLRVNDQEYDLHISTHPTPWGERIELRFAL